MVRVALFSVIQAFHIRAVSHLTAFGEGGKVSDVPVMGSINKFRAQQCAERPDPWEHEDCMEFMKEICNPGGNDGTQGERPQMDGEAGEISSGEGFCKKFFNGMADKKKKEDETKKKEEEEVERKRREEKERKRREEEERKRREEEERKRREEEERKLQDGEASSRRAAELAAGDESIDLGPKSHLPVPEQGFSGPVVTHDTRTTISNWSKEYGPKGEPHNYEEICKRHPDNVWCRGHGYSRSNAFCSMLSLFVFALLF
eukprot:GEMP01056513.1.p2 GENE.GEMP01056513.1~~GEMP01056513.1.p2  ORF type:complete len:259 (+),score=71.19 GEMP01056513.1:195-971(+)